MNYSNYDIIPHYKPELDPHLILISQLTDGSIDKDYILTYFDNKFTFNQLFEFDTWFTECLEDICFGGPCEDEDLTDYHHTYDDLIQEYIESKGHNFYDLLDKYKEKIQLEDDLKKQPLKDHLNSIPKYPPEGKGLDIPQNFLNDLLLLHTKLPKEDDFTIEFIENYGQKYWLHQIHGLENKIKYHKKQLGLD